jgi:hypothetical protein
MSLLQKVAELEDSQAVDLEMQQRRPDGQDSQSALLPPLPSPTPSKVSMDGSINSANENTDSKKKKKGHQRRLSEATTSTVSSQSTASYPQRFQSQQLHQQQQVSSGMSQNPSFFRPQEKQRLSWFGMAMAKRRSVQISLEDFKRPHVLGHGIEGGMGSRRTSRIFVEDDDLGDSDDDDDDHDPQPYRQSEDLGRSMVRVNDYGFILPGGGPAQVPEQRRMSMFVGVGDVSKLDPTFLIEHERKKATKKQQEQARADELKWVQSWSQQPDQIKKNAKVSVCSHAGSFKWMTLSAQMCLDI